MLIVAALRDSRRRVKLQRARMTLDQFKAIYDAAGSMDDWAQNAFALALLNAQRLSKVFQEARELAGLTWPAFDENGRKHTPPSFHELRSLAKRLYTEQGNVDTKALLGQRGDRTANLYGDPRGAEWITVKVG